MVSNKKSKHLPLATICFANKSQSKKLHTNALSPCYTFETDAGTYLSTVTKILYLRQCNAMSVLVGTVNAGAAVQSFSASDKIAQLLIQKVEHPDIVEHSRGRRARRDSSRRRSVWEY